MSEGSVLSIDKINSNPPPQILSDTPIPSSDDEELTDVDVERVESCPKRRKTSLFQSDSYYTPLIENPVVPTSTATFQPPSNYPLSHSVQSLISNKFQTHQSSLIHSNVSTPLSSRDSIPEPECEEDSKQAINGNDVFCLVRGRLSLSSTRKKYMYNVSVDELRRRLSNTEGLSATMLGAILRRAKCESAADHLRQNLKDKGLSLSPVRKRAKETTLFTSLVEEEALHLASDHRIVCQNYFPHQELAQIIGKRDANTQQAQGRLQMIQGAQILLLEFKTIVDTAISNYPSNNSTNISPGLANFDLMSHRFGNPNISTVVNVLQNYLYELTRVYDGTHQQHPAQTSSYSSIATPNNIPVNNNICNKGVQ